MYIYSLICELYIYILQVNVLLQLRCCASYQWVNYLMSYFLFFVRYMDLYIILSYLNDIQEEKD